VLVIPNKIVAFEKKRDSESFINGVAIHFVRTDAQQEQINATIKKSVVCEKYVSDSRLHGKCRRVWLIPAVILFTVMNTASRPTFRLKC